jgi:hypothetical protein
LALRQYYRFWGRHSRFPARSRRNAAAFLVRPTVAAPSVVGVTATGDQVLVEATGPNPAPGLALLRRDLDAAGLNGLDVRVNLVPASYQPLPK